MSEINVNIMYTFKFYTLCYFVTHFVFNNWVPIKLVCTVEIEVANSDLFNFKRAFFEPEIKLLKYKKFYQRLCFIL